MFPETVYLVGGGPSAGDVERLNALSERAFVIAINRAGVELTKPRAIFWTDYRVWRWYGEAFKAKDAQLVHASFDSPEDPAYELWSLERFSPLNFQQARDRRVLPAGYCAGYSAIFYAALRGARKIYLIGFDGGTDHWHAPHPVETPESASMRMGLGFSELADFLKDRGIEVWNASPASRLRDFPICTPAEALSETPTDRRGRPPAEVYVDVPFGGAWRGERFHRFQTVKRPGPRTVVLAWGARRAAHWRQRGHLTVLVENGPLSFWNPGSVVFQNTAVNADTRNLRPPTKACARIPPIRTRKLPGSTAPILVVGQMGAPDARSMPYDWPEKIVKEINGRCSGRLVLFRPHPLSELPEPRGYSDILRGGDLVSQVRTSWAVVCWSSAVGLVGLSEGVPVFNLGAYGWARPAAFYDLRELPAPVRPSPERVETLFRALAEVNVPDEEIGLGWMRFWR